MDLGPLVTLRGAYESMAPRTSPRPPERRDRAVRGEAEAGTSIQLGATWAEPLLAIVPLGVCWWRTDSWPKPLTDAGVEEVAGHIRRVRQIARWADGVLGRSLAGSSAFLAGHIVTNGQLSDQSSLLWSRDNSGAAGVLAVAVIVSGGIWARMKLASQLADEPPRVVAIDCVARRGWDAMPGLAARPGRETVFDLALDARTSSLRTHQPSSRSRRSPIPK